MIELAEMVKKVVNPKAELVWLENTADDPSRRRPDITKVKTLLGWEPKVSGHAVGGGGGGGGGVCVCVGGGGDKGEHALCGWWWWWWKRRMLRGWEPKARRARWGRVFGVWGCGGRREGAEGVWR